jgi:thymidine kinase
MSLELILGPMWAGKSSVLLGYIRRHKAIGWKVMVVTSALDNRYGQDTVSSHDKEQAPAIATKTLMPLLNNPEYKEARLILLEESQFFPDLYDFVLHAVDHDQKSVVCVGLDGDSERKPFGQILQLIPLCDHVRKITSLCGECGDGTPALFSHRVTDVNSQVAVGAENLYKPLCRKHYLAHRVQINK